MIVLICSICWTLAYIFAIRRGFKDKTCGFPVIAVLFNVAWEFGYTVIYPGISPVGFVALIWLALDLIILGQIFMYRDRLSQIFKRKTSPLFPIITGLLFFIGVIVAGEVNQFWIITSAFGQNLVMSILFVSMLFTRRHTGGQTVYIGMLKMVGTGIVVVPLLLDPLILSMFKKTIFAGIIIFDMAYTVGIYIKIKRQGESPFLHW